MIIPNTTKKTRLEKIFFTLNEKISKITFLSSIKESSVLWRVADLNDFGASQQLHDQAGGDNGRNAELHQRASIRRHDHSHPVEWIGRVR